LTIETAFQEGNTASRAEIIWQEGTARHDGPLFHGPNLQQEAPMGSPEQKQSRVVSARVIKWDEDNFGVAVDYIDHQHTAYVVGTKEQALAEAVEIRAGKR
jgi:hypothetical protein